GRSSRLAARAAGPNRATPPGHHIAESQLMERLAEHWIRWWYAAGGPAQPEWCVERAASHQAMLLSAPISRHEYLAVSRAVLLPQPPEPHQGLMQWIGLP